MQSMALFKPFMLDERHPLTKWIVCFSAAFFFFYEFIQMNMFNAISNNLMQTFHISGEDLSQLSSTYFYADVIFLFPAGLLLDRFSTRKIILQALGICIVSTFVFAGARTFWIASLAHFAAGIGNAFCFLSCMILASRWFPARQLALATGLIVTFAMLGGAVAQTPFELLTHYTSWRMAVLINAFLGVIIFIFILLFVTDKPMASTLDYGRELSNIPKLHFWPSIKLSLSNRQNWFCGLYTSFLNLPLMVLGGLWGSLFLEQVHHFTRSAATTISSMLFIGTIVGSPFFGAISDKMGKRKFPMLLGAITAFFTTLILMYVTSFNFLSALLLFYFLGFFTSSQVISYPVISESNRKAITGTSLGLASVLIMGGAGLSQQLFGTLIDLHWNKLIQNGAPVYNTNDFQLALAVFPITLCLALGLAIFIKETNCIAQQH